MRKHLTCHADDMGLVCGYPLPCPKHTAIIDVSNAPPVVVDIPEEFPEPRAIRHLTDIAAALLGKGESA